MVGQRPSPLVAEVCLVAHKHDDDVLAPLRANVLDPLGGLLERVAICSTGRRRQVCREKSENVQDATSGTGLGGGARKGTAPWLAGTEPRDSVLVIS